MKFAKPEKNEERAARGVRDRAPPSRAERREPSIMRGLQTTRRFASSGGQTGRQQTAVCWLNINTSIVTGVRATTERCRRNCNIKRED